MAELATIARPYAEALIAAGADASTVSQATVVAAVAIDAELLSFAAHPKTTDQQVFDLVVQVAGVQSLSIQVQNLLRTVIENGRLPAMAEVARQAQALLDARSGVSQAQVFSAYALDDAQIADLRTTLEKRFSRRLEISVEIDPSLIGGIRAVVGDEVLDTSVKVRLAWGGALLITLTVLVLNIIARVFFRDQGSR